MFSLYFPDPVGAVAIITQVNAEKSASVYVSAAVVVYFNIKEWVFGHAVHYTAFSPLVVSKVHSLQSATAVAGVVLVW